MHKRSQPPIKGATPHAVKQRPQHSRTPPVSFIKGRSGAARSNPHMPCVWLNLDAAFKQKIPAPSMAADPATNNAPSALSFGQLDELFAPLLGAPVLHVILLDAHANHLMLTNNG